MLQNLIANSVSEMVINLFEKIQIDNQY